MRHLACAAVALLVAACAVPAAPRAVTAPAVLTPAAPVARIALAPPPPSRDAVLEIDVVEVHNPARIPVAVAVALQEDDEQSPAHAVTEVALFPADQPGRFVARADRALAKVGNARGEDARLWARVQLRLPPGQAATDDVPRLRVGVRWATVPMPR